MKKNFSRVLIALCLAVVVFVAIMLGKSWLSKPTIGQIDSRISDRSKEFVQDNKENTQLQVPAYLANGEDFDDAKQELLQTPCFDFYLPLEVRYLRVDTATPSANVAPSVATEASPPKCSVRALATDPRAQLTITHQVFAQPFNLAEQTGVTIRAKNAKFVIPFLQEDEYRAFESESELIIFYAYDNSLTTIAFFEVSEVSDKLKYQAVELLKLIQAQLDLSDQD